MTMDTTITIIKQAEEFCAAEGHRLTDPRKYVLQIMAEGHKAMTAYDILDRLGQYLENPKPPTAYRAIEFWETHGFIHRIESLNAYILCEAGHKHDGSQFMICDTCGDVNEAHVCHLPDVLNGRAEFANFTVARWTTELHGQCHNCSESVEAHN
jgi:Fur family zinc uptake transcriptional regulator